MRMAGHMGDARVTVKNLRIVRVDPERNLVAIRARSPARAGGLIIVEEGLGDTDARTSSTGPARSSASSTWTTTLFGPTNQAVVHQAVVTQLAPARARADTQTRAEVAAAARSRTARRAPATRGRARAARRTTATAAWSSGHTRARTRRLPRKMMRLALLSPLLACKLRG